MVKKFYIAYGSNLNKRQMHWRCYDAEPVATSWLEDHALVFQGNHVGAHANVIPHKGKRVPVAIWSISQDDERALDRYEGVAAGYYTKEYMEVDVNGQKKTALIYIMAPHGYGMPSMDYYNTILRGYRDFNLSTGPLTDALLKSTEKAK